MGQKQKTEKKEEEEEERLNDGDNNGQATHGARKHAWRTQAAWPKISSSPEVLQRLQETILTWLRWKRRDLNTRTTFIASIE